MRARSSLPVLALLACTSAEPRAPDPTPAPTPPPPSLVEPVAPPPPPPSPPQADPDIEDLDPTGALVPAPTADPIAAALAPANPFAVVIVDRKPIGKDMIVLFAIDLLGDSEDSFAWELARVHEGATGLEIRARTRVWGPAPGSLPAADVAHKLKVYDVDDDKRSEVTVIVPIAVVPVEDEPVEGDGEIGAIFDASDLHVQLAVTRRLDTQREDVFGSESHAATAWVAKDLDGDGHADLTLTTKVMDKDNVGCDVDCDDVDEEEATRPRRSSAKQVCPYDVAGDRWVCPSPQLGLELLVGNDGVQPIVGAP
jgi:hypothetical protein